MKIKSGDKVFIKEDFTLAEVIELLHDNKVKIKDVDGFDHIVHVSRIAQIDGDYSHPYPYISFSEEIQEDTKEIRSQNKIQDFSKIDLHIDQRIENISNQEIILDQMNFCKQRLDLAIAKKLDIVEIIHGIGSGVLKDAVHELLDSYHFTYFESMDGGSTKVML